MWPSPLFMQFVPHSLGSSDSLWGLIWWSINSRLSLSSLSLLNCSLETLERPMCGLWVKSSRTKRGSDLGRADLGLPCTRAYTPHIHTPQKLGHAEDVIAQLITDISVFVGLMRFWNFFVYLFVFVSLEGRLISKNLNCFSMTSIFSNTQ